MSGVLVLGATGTTGSRVAAFLRGRGVPVRTASRRGDPRHVRFDWTERETYAPALRRVSAVYLVGPVGVADPVPFVEPFLEEAVRQGVRRVVQLSSSAVPEGAPGLGEVHRLVRTTVPEWAVLRPSWFMQNFTGPSLELRERDGDLLSATGKGRVAFIDAGDIAAVAGHALTDERSHDTDHVLTGPEALSYDDVAALLTERHGRPVRHRAVPVEELAGHFAQRGLSPEYAALLAALDDDIRGGAEDRVTDTVERVTGRPPRPFREAILADE
ncbi:NmrA family NAD(P)-binding protein [Nonomuraea sp. FMUSA5-5]|uniref:NmrA family NAD(P)-binding protein n=1 Tax=Nonomuraea composti TaxID=2720023 RepID=A0ABX1B0B2_9ACTN|nr:NAD-dependent epimerase/dehydratase family protein [Nonomuraea sp. FMUSA5-5]NJP88596.1 NmrA family NAD(P)-binding protein [Nonomuraea sp. FMUSA5-5]